MKRLMNKKVAAIGLAAGLALGVAGGAFAYFTSTGSGSGSGTVGSSTAVTVVQDSITYNGPSDGAPTSLKPGDTATVAFGITNPGGNEYVGSIHLASWTSDKAGCDSADDAGWITMPDVNVSQNFPNGIDETTGDTGTITFNDLGVNQNVCQGASLTFNYTSN
jgi:hypothetical protein